MFLPKRDWMILAGALASGAALIAILGREPQGEVVRTEYPESAQEALKPKTAAPIDQNIYQPYERDKGYNKTFAKWGTKGVARIQRLREAAAVTASNNPQCDAVELSELSDARSTPPNNPVVFVDCRNSQRFYLGEADVGGAISTEMEKGAQFSSRDLISRCTEQVIAKLNLPSSFNRDLFSVSDRQGTTGNRVVEFTFQAKNGLGMALPASARCIMTTQGKFEVEIIEE